MVSGNTFGVTQEGSYAFTRDSGLFYITNVFLSQFTKCQKVEFGKLGAIGSLLDVINITCFKETRKLNGNLRRISTRYLLKVISKIVN